MQMFSHLFAESSLFLSLYTGRVMEMNTQMDSELIYLLLKKRLAIAEWEGGRIGDSLNRGGSSGEL